MIAYIHPQKILSETSENCKLAPIPFIVCGKRLVFLNFITVTQCNLWAMIRTMCTPLPKCCKDELQFLNYFSPLAFMGQVPGRSARALLHFQAPFRMQNSPLISRFPQRDQQFLLKTRQKSCEEVNRNSTISVSVTPASFALLQYTEDH